MDGCGLKKICFIYRYYHPYLHKFRFASLIISHARHIFQPRITAAMKVFRIAAVIF